MDGSAADFVSAIDQAGRVQQSRSRRYLKILKPVRVERDGGCAEFLPAERGFRLDVEIDFNSPAIGRQRRVFDLDPRHLPPGNRPRPHVRLCQRRPEAVAGGLRARLLAREFGRHRRGHDSQSRGASLRRRIRAPQGARRRRRPVAGRSADRSASIATYRPGHKLNAAALDALFANRSAYEYVEAPASRAFAKGFGVGAHVPAAAAAFAAAD